MFFQCRPKQRAPLVFPRPPCARQGCNRKALKCETKEQGGIFFSFYCKAHACRHRAGNVMCPNDKQPGHTRYCEDHTRCHAQNCPRPRKAADKDEIWAYCHKHTCFLEGCHLKRTAGSQMCAPHTPRCLIPDCPDPRSPNGLYCPSHSCAAPDCDAVIAAGAWCRAHTPCRIAGCRGARAVLPSGCRDDVCAEHTPRACRGGGPGGCTALVDGGVRFCPAHECGQAGCREGREVRGSDLSRGGFCEAHTCQTSLCPLSVASAEGKHCAAHECRVPECKAARAGESGHCALVHACSVAGCPGQRTVDGPCCGVHNAILLRDGLMASVPGRQQPQPQQQGQAPLSPMEEALSRRLMQERARQESEARLREEMMAWREGVPYGVGVRERMRSWDTAAEVGLGGGRSRDSGLGTSSDDCTFVL